MPRTILTTPRDIYTEQGRIVGGNLLKNGSMSNIILPASPVPTTAGKRWINGTVGGSTIDTVNGWGTGNVGAGSYVEFDNTEAHSGSYSLHFKITQPASFAEAYSIGQFDTLLSMKNHAYPLQIGDYYSSVEVTWWAKTNIISGTTGGGISAGISAFSGSGIIAAGALANGVNVTQDWTQYRATFALQNAGTRFIICKLSFASTDATTGIVGDAWVDDVQMKMLIPVYRAYI